LLRSATPLIKRVQAAAPDRQPPLDGGPRAVLSVGTEQYSYDANGALTSGGGRAYTWNLDQQPSEIDYGPGTPPTYVEQYSYDGDGERLTRSHGGLTTMYLAGGWRWTR
jgi:hypothetical protein